LFSVESWRAPLLFVRTRMSLFWLCLSCTARRSKLEGKRWPQGGCVLNVNFLACFALGDIAETRVKKGFGQKQCSARLLCPRYLQNIPEWDSGTNYADTT
jgi:hypothetical protein